METIDCWGTDPENKGVYPRGEQKEELDLGFVNEEDEEIKSLISTEPHKRFRQESRSGRLDKAIAMTHKVLVNSTIKLHLIGETELGNEFSEHEKRLQEIEVLDGELKLRMLYHWAKSLSPLMGKGAKALGYERK